MNVGNEMSLPEEEARFDRLVDGELSSEEYRALVAALDHEPGGWRSCALAFMESQALAGELGHLRRSLDLRPQKSISRPAAPPFWPGGRTLLAMAACFALAFGLGVALPRWVSSPQDGAVSGNLSFPPEMIADNGWEDGRHTTMRPIGNVQIFVNGEDGTEHSAGELPVHEIGQNLEQYLADSQPGLDPYLLEWLRRQGYEVDMRQQFIPGRLEDGRPLYVPVEQYQITPVKRSY